MTKDNKKALTRANIIYKLTSELIPYARNSRTHSEAQVSQIAASIKEFGFTNPVLLDGDNGIIAGHGRVMAAKKLGIDEVPCIELSHLTKAQKQAYIIADNKLALNAGWDEEMLKIELSELQTEGFDIDLIGFNEDEIEELLGEQITAGLTDEDSIPEPPVEPKTKLGDVWLLGRHRLMCGDSTKIDDVEKLMAGHKADMLLTDPPYGISIVKQDTKTVGFGDGKLGFKNKKGSVGADGIVPVGQYAPIIGDDSLDTAKEIYQIAIALEIKNIILWGGNYYTEFVPASPCWLIWDKRGDIPSNNFADAEIAWTNMSSPTRVYKQVWSGMLREGERNIEGLKRCHPTQKPVGLSEWCIKEYKGEKILDLFGGSGGTLLAAEKLSKINFTMEMSPDYCDVIIQRWQDYAGQKATLESDGRLFNEV